MSNSKNCKHKGLAVVCGHGRSPGVLPGWAPNADPEMQSLVLQVLTEDKVSATTKIAAGPCGSHVNLIHIADARNAQCNGTTGSFKAEGVEVSRTEDTDYILWPVPGRWKSYDITAASCFGETDPPVIVQVFPLITNKLQISVNFGDTKANLSKSGGGKDTYETTWESGISISGESKVNSETIKLSASSTDEKSRFRQFPTLCKSVGGATGWVAEHCSRLAGCEITFKGPNATLSGEWGWKEDSGSCACGFEFSGSVTANPLLGLDVEKDISTYVFAAWPAALALKEALEGTDSGELKILLGAKTTFGGDLKGTKNFTEEKGVFDGKLEGEIEASATGKAAVEKEVFWITVSAGVEIGAKTGLKAALKGDWETEEGPAVSASLSFSGVIFTACGWVGVNSSPNHNTSKSRGDTKKKTNADMEWEAIPAKDDFLATPKWHPFK